MIYFCNCLLFDLWYEESGFRVCKCGHPDAEHLDHARSCTGEVWLSKGMRK